jgi:hypothetical protein
MKNKPLIAMAVFGLLAFAAQAQVVGINGPFNIALVVT